ncbi:MAG: thioredoxin family protein [Clostridiaceae bacterium]|nr:thioredoxin family protein [Clostridiaceae bacterium]
MKPILMFILKGCPYCKKALNWMEELKNENPKYAGIEVQIVDEQEQAELAAQHDYFYVPAYYINGEKVHEGAATKEIVKQVFDKACE